MAAAAVVNADCGAGGSIKAASRVGGGAAQSTEWQGSGAAHPSPTIPRRRSCRRPCCLPHVRAHAARFRAPHGAAEHVPSGPKPAADAVSNAAAASPHAVADTCACSEHAADARARADPGALPAPSPPPSVRPTLHPRTSPRPCPRERRGWAFSSGAVVARERVGGWGRNDVRHLADAAAKGAPWLIQANMDCFRDGLAIGPSSSSDRAPWPTPSALRRATAVGLAHIARLQEEDGQHEALLAPAPSSSRVRAGRARGDGHGGLVLGRARADIARGGRGGSPHGAPGGWRAKFRAGRERGGGTCLGVPGRGGRCVCVRRRDQAVDGSGRSQREAEICAPSTLVDGALGLEI